MGQWTMPASTSSKPGKHTLLPDGRLGHGELVPAALEVVVGEDGAAHNGQVRVGAHKVVGQTA